MAKRRLKWLAVAWMTTIAVVLSTSPAQASTCNAEEQIFVRSTSARTNTKGTRNRILFTNRDLDSGCPGALTLSTAHVARDFTQNNPSGDWVEIGWQILWVGVGNKDWRIFTEKGFDFVIERLVDRSATEQEYSELVSQAPGCAEMEDGSTECNFGLRSFVTLEAGAKAFVLEGDVTTALHLLADVPLGNKVAFARYDDPAIEIVVMGPADGFEASDAIAVANLI